MFVDDEIASKVSDALKKDPTYYSMDAKGNIQKCREDVEYMGEVLIANENLIWHSIRKYIGNPKVIVENNCLEKDDILQLGRMGFIKAVNAFDVSKGVKFSSFAVVAIVREVKCFLRDSGHVIRPSRSAYGLNYKIAKLLEGSTEELSNREIAEALNEPMELVEKASTVGKRVLYLCDCVEGGGESSMTYIDAITDVTSEYSHKVVDRLYVEEVLKNVSEQLDKRERYVLNGRLNNLSQKKMAEQLGVSRETVRDMLHKILDTVAGELRWYSGINYK